MHKKVFYICFGFILSNFIAMGIGAQTTFEVSNRSIDYGSYFYIEDCVAAAFRISDLPRIQSGVVDTFLVVRKAKYNSISQVAKDTGQTCANRWLTGLSSLSDKEFVKEWVNFFIILGKNAEVKKRYSRYIDSLPDQEKLSAKGSLAALFYRFRDSSTVNEWLELSNDFFNAIPKDSFSLVASSFASKVVNWVGLWEPEKADTALNLYLDFLDSLPVDKRKNPVIVNLLAPRFFETALLVKEPVALSNLLKSTTAYSEYIKELWKKVGNDRPLILPLDSIAPPVKGNWWYAPKNVNGSEVSVLQISGDSVSKIAQKGIKVIVFMEPGCHTSSPKAGNNAWVRQNSEGVGCVLPSAALNRLKETYPEIQILVVSRTFGSFGSTLSASPHAEAETMAKYIIEHFKVNAYVAVEKGEFFTLPGLDRRRVDLPTENDANFTIANSKLSRNGNAVLVDPDGKIFYSGSITEENEVGVRNMVGTVMKRIQSQTAQR